MALKFSTRSSLLKRQQRRLAKFQFWKQRQRTNDANISWKIKKVINVSNKRRISLVKDMVLRRGKRKDYEHSGSFQEAIKPVVFIAQIFALIPVQGITSNKAENLNFSWKHLRTYYSLLSIFGYSVFSGFTIANAFRLKFSFASIETIIFYSLTCTIGINFFQLAQKWPTLLQHWESVERKLPPLQTENARSQTAKRIKMILFVIIISSLIEHLLSMLTLLYYVNACPAIPNNPINSFLFSSFEELFHFVGYHAWKGIFSEVLNFFATIVWNYNDILIMCISVALSGRFRQLNEYMAVALRRPTSEKFWIRSREHYRSLCQLCDKVDDAVSFITLVCFSNNLFFICGKILKSIQKKPSIAHTLYFWFALFYLLIRTFVLSLYTAEINDESKQPLRIFRAVKQDSWCPELKRFSEEVTTDIIALSGMKFFQLTRSLVMSVAGTIVTYELILLQLNKQDKVNDCNES